MRMDHDGEAWQFALAGGGALASGGMVKIGTAAVLKSISGTILAGVSAVTPAGWFAIGTIVTVSSVVYFKGKTKSKDEVDPYGRAGQKSRGERLRTKVEEKTILTLVIIREIKNLRSLKSTHQWMIIVSINRISN